ncbi:MAG: T9SS type A sorting domain-containing protein [Ignavibacteriae bacterium]|nr:T9SS type A sorting domain-containing protein [Ignavibacteriota bacterium]
MKHLYCCIIIILASNLLGAQEYWEKISPDGQFVNFTKVPNSDICISITDAGEIFRSTDDGYNWTNSEFNLNHNVSEFRYINGNLYASNPASTSKSTDNGISWAGIFTSDNESSEWHFEGNNNGELIRTVSKKIYYSSNSGNSWNLVHTLSEDSPTILKAKIDDSSRIHIFLRFKLGNTFLRKIIHSEDYGNTWEFPIFEYPAEFFYDFDLSLNGTRYILIKGEINSYDVLKWGVNDISWDYVFNTDFKTAKVFADDFHALVAAIATTEHEYKIFRTSNNGLNWDEIRHHSISNSIFNPTHFDYNYDEKLLSVRDSANIKVFFKKAGTLFEPASCPISSLQNSVYVDNNLTPFRVTGSSSGEDGSGILRCNKTVICNPVNYISNWGNYIKYINFIDRNGEILFGPYKYKGNKVWTLDDWLENVPLNYAGGYAGGITNQFYVNGKSFVARHRGIYISHDNGASYQALPIENMYLPTLNVALDEINNDILSSGNIFIKFSHLSSWPPNSYDRQWIDNQDTIKWNDFPNNYTRFTDHTKKRYHVAILGSDTVFASEFPTGENYKMLRIWDGNSYTNSDFKIDDDFADIKSNGVDKFWITRSRINNLTAGSIVEVNGRFNSFETLPEIYFRNFLQSINNFDFLNGKIYVSTGNGVYRTSKNLNLPKLTLNVKGSAVTTSIGDTLTLEFTLFSENSIIDETVKINIFNPLIDSTLSIAVDSTGKLFYNFIISDSVAFGDYQLSAFATGDNNQSSNTVPVLINVADFNSNRYYIHENEGFKIIFDAGLNNEFINNAGKLSLKNQQEIRINDILVYNGSVEIDINSFTFSGNGELFIENSIVPGSLLPEKFVLFNGNFSLNFFNPNLLIIPHSYSSAFDNATKFFGAVLEIDSLGFLRDNKVVSGIKFDAAVRVPGVKGSCEAGVQSKLILREMEFSKTGINLTNASLQNIGLIPTVCIKDLSVSYESEKDSLFISGELSTSFFESIVAECGLIGGNINFIGLSVTTTQPIPIIGTPIGLKSISGSVSGIVNPPLIIEIGATLSSIKEGLFEINLTGELEIPNRISFLANGNFIKIPGDDKWQIVSNIGGELDVRSHINLFGNVQALTLGGSDYFISASADLNYVWSPSERLSGNLNGNVTIQEVEDWQGNIIYDLVDKFVGLPYQIANGELAFEDERIAGQFSSQLPIFGSVDIFMTADLSQNFPECCEIGLGSVNINEFVKQGIPPAFNLPSGDEGLIDNKRDSPIVLKNIPYLLSNTRRDTIPVAYNTSMIIAMISSSNILPESSIKNPEGNTFTQTNQDTTIVYHENVSKKVAVWLLKNPQQGEWIIEFIDSDENDSLDVFAFFNQEIADINIIKNDNDIQFLWDGTPAEDSTVYDFYIDNNNEGFNGLFIGSAYEHSELFEFTFQDNFPHCDNYFYVVKKEGGILIRKYLDTIVQFDKNNIQAPSDFSFSYNSTTDSLTFSWQSNILNVNGFIIKQVKNSNDSTIAVLDAQTMQFSLKLSDFEGEYFYMYSFSESGDISCQSSLFRLEKPALEMHNISLNQGWNLISTYVDPENTSIPVVWEDVKENVVIIKNNAGATYIPSFDIDGIVNWNVIEGYQVYASQSDSLIITGQQVVPEDNDIALTSGWKIVSYLRNSPMNIIDALVTLTDDEALVIAKNNSGGTYLPMFDINTIGNMQPGQGYQMYLSKNSTLTYPANSSGKRAMAGEPFVRLPKILKPEHSHTGNNSTLVVLADTPDGNEIGIYSENDVLIGSGIFFDGKAAVTIWGDNPQTPETDGAKANYELRMKNYDVNTGRISEVEISELTDIISGDGYSQLTYKRDALILAKAKVESQGSDLSLSVRPNPFSDELAIEFNLMNEEEVSVRVYDVSGGLVRSLYAGQLNAGSQKFSLNGSNLASGEYTIILTIGNERFMRKIVRVK